MNSEDKKIRVIIKEPEQPSREMTVDDTLEEYQRLVGGYIELVRVSKGMGLIVNEEGKMMGLKPCMYCFGDLLVGTVVCVGLLHDEFTDCPLTLGQFRKFIHEGGVEDDKTV